MSMLMCVAQKLKAKQGSHLHHARWSQIWKSWTMHKWFINHHGKIEWIQWTLCAVLIHPDYFSYNIIQACVLALEVASVFVLQSKVAKLRPQPCNLNINVATCHNVLEVEAISVYSEIFHVMLAENPHQKLLRRLATWLCLSTITP